MTDEFERKQSQPNLRHYLEISLEEVRKITKTSVIRTNLRAEILKQNLPK
jgi:hypothetical protein